MGSDSQRSKNEEMGNGKWVAISLEVFGVGADPLGRWEYLVLVIYSIAGSKK